MLRTLIGTLRPTVTIASLAAWAVACACLTSVASGQAYVVGGSHVSVDVLNLFFSHPVDEDQKVRESMGRGYTVGDAHTEGEVTVRLNPNTMRAECVFHLQGKLGIDNAFSVHGSVRVRSRVRTCVSASKTVYFDEQGMTTEGAIANCRTNLGLMDVTADRPLVECIGTRRAHRSRGEMQQLVSNKTARQFEARLDQRIGAAMENLTEQLRTVMRMQDGQEFSVPDGFSFKSTQRHMELWAKSDEAPNPTKEVRLDPNLDVQSLFHESVATALTELYLGGRTLTDEEILGLVQRIRGSAPPALWVHDRRPRWSMTLAKKRPIELHFQDGNIRAVVHLSGASLGEQRLEAPMDVSLTVRPEFADGGFRLRRMAMPVVMIDPSAQSVASADVAAIADMLEAKFLGIFPEYGYFDGMAMPRGGSWDKLRQLRFVHLYPDDGWFRLEMKFVETDRPPDESAEQSTDGVATIQSPTGSPNGSRAE